MHDMIIIDHNIINVIIIFNMGKLLYVIYICLTDIIYDLSADYEQNQHVYISF